MAASWHTMAVISCPVLFCSLQWIPVGYKRFSTGRKNSDPPTPPSPVVGAASWAARLSPHSPGGLKLLPSACPTCSRRRQRGNKIWDGGKEQLLVLLMQLTAQWWTGIFHPTWVSLCWLHWFGMVEVNPGEMKPSHPFPPALSVRLSLLLLIATTTVHMGNGGESRHQEV